MVRFVWPNTLNNSDAARVMRNGPPIYVKCGVRGTNLDSLQGELPLVLQILVLLLPHSLQLDRHLHLALALGGLGGLLRARRVLRAQRVQRRAAVADLRHLVLHTHRMLSAPIPFLHLSTLININ